MSPRAPRREEACEGGLGSGSQQACVSPWCFTAAEKGAVFGPGSEERRRRQGMQLWTEKGRREKLGRGQLLRGAIGGPFVPCQEKSVTNYLCLSPKGQLWKLFGWVLREDA